jgi:hypothetical protein
MGGKLIYPSADKGFSANFAMVGFCEVRSQLAKRFKKRFKKDARP